MMVCAGSKLEKESWIRALTEYQILNLEARMKRFAERIAE